MSAHNPVSSAVAANSHTSVTQRAHYESTTIAQRVLLTFLLIALRGFVSLMVEKYNEGGKKINICLTTQLRIFYTETLH